MPTILIIRITILIAGCRFCVPAYNRLISAVRQNVLVAPIPEKQLRYIDLYTELARDLADGVYPVGSRFPIEADLQRRFGVGRHTAREALKKLTDEGFIERRPKSGTIVISTDPAVRYVQPLGTIDNLFDFGIATDLHVQFFGHVRLRDARMCERLKLQHNDRWLRIAGLRVLRETDTPLCWSEFYLPPEYAIKREQLDELVGPIYSKVLKHHGLQLDRVDQEIGVTALNPTLSRLLHAPIGSPAMTQVRRYFEDGGKLFQSTLNIYPAGRYFMHSTFRRVPS